MHSCGVMNIECYYCHSLNFQAGRSFENGFNLCCLKGIVLVEAEGDKMCYSLAFQEHCWGIQKIEIIDTSRKIFDHKTVHLVSLRWAKKSNMLLAMVFMF